jgi:tetratricopeptide (TPR) repeat protein
MFNVASTFAQAEQNFQQGRLEEAEQLLVKVRRAVPFEAQPFHLSALVAKRMGRQNEARTFFRQALERQPNDPQILTNLGNLLNELGQTAEALQCYDKAVRLAPRLADARLNRALLLRRLERPKEALIDLETLLAAGAKNARLLSAYAATLRDLDRLSEAAAAFDASLRLDPGRLVSLLGRARVALERGDPKAVDYHRAALAADPSNADLQLGLAEALEANGQPGAIATLEAAVAVQPSWIEGQRTRARMRWEAGEEQAFSRGFEVAVTERPSDIALWEAYVASLAGAGYYAQASDAAARGWQCNQGSQALRLLEASYASEAGQLERAEQIYQSLPANLPGQLLAKARHALRVDDLERASKLTEQARAESRWDVHAWALTGLVWRMAGDERAEWLHGQPGLVSVRELDLSADAIGSIAAHLRSLHRTRTHPLGQSLRGGTQTRGRLFSRDEPETIQLRGAISAALAEQWDALPPFDAGHPLLRHRDRQFRLAGSWSVRLTGSGFHVAHIHPEGVLSSACYLAVPQGQEREGWLEIGCVPEGLRLPLKPLRSVEPQPGRMALFPSTLYHGTRPFRLGERLTAAFDVVTE